MAAVMGEGGNDGEEPDGHEGAEQEAVAGEVGADGWKRAYRTQQPEKAGPSLLKLQTAWKACGSKIADITWGLRRRSAAMARATHVESEKRKKASASQVRQQLKADASSTDGSSSGCSTSSGNSALDDVV